MGMATVLVELKAAGGSSRRDGSDREEDMGAGRKVDTANELDPRRRERRRKELESYPCGRAGG